MYSILLTSFWRVGSAGRATRAMPLQTTARSSTKTERGDPSSGGISTTSTPSSRSSWARAWCCLRASSSCTSPRVRSDRGIRQSTACVYRTDILAEQTNNFIPARFPFSFLSGCSVLRFPATEPHHTRARSFLTFVDFLISILLRVLPLFCSLAHLRASEKSPRRSGSTALLCDYIVCYTSYSDYTPCLYR